MRWELAIADQINRAIADALFLSPATVKSHLQALFEHFGVQDLPPTRKRMA